jgi:hypothetical protein
VLPTDVFAGSAAPLSAYRKSGFEEHEIDYCKPNYDKAKAPNEHVTDCGPGSAPRALTADLTSVPLSSFAMVSSRAPARPHSLGVPKAVLFPAASLGALT